MELDQVAAKILLQDREEDQKKKLQKSEVNQAGT